MVKNAAKTHFRTFKKVKWGAQLWELYLAWQGRFFRYDEVMSDDKGIIDYGELIDRAMHIIVREVLRRVQKTGLPGDHHFYITFLTHYPGVMISDTLREKYPDEMTIVIQHQFWDLEVEEDRFSIVLSFNNVQENLTIPFNALTGFADPSVKFGLQFHHVQMLYEIGHDSEEDESGADIEPMPSKSRDGKKRSLKGDSKPITDGSNIISLDQLRKEKNNDKK